MITRGTDFKLIIIGNSFIGKTTMLKKYTGKLDIGREPFVTKKIERDGAPLTLLIHDTMGQERYRSLTSSFYRGARGCMLCFDVYNTCSLDDLKHWIYDIKDCMGDGIPKLLIGINRSNISRKNSFHGHDEIRPKIPRDKIDFFREEQRLTYLEVDLNDVDKITGAFDTLVDLVIADKLRRQSEIDETGVIHLPRTNNKNVKETRSNCSC